MDETRVPIFVIGTEFPQEEPLGLARRGNSFKDIYHAFCFILLFNPVTISFRRIRNRGEGREGMRREYLRL